MIRSAVSPTARLFAEIALPVPLNKTFHYSIPGALQGKVIEGVRVTVPFGRRTMTGFVVSTLSNSDVAGTKDIISVVDESPFVLPALFSLAKWISHNYLCSLGEALATVASLKLRPPKRPKKTNQPVIQLPAATVAPVLEQQQRLAVNTIFAAVDARHFEPFLLRGVTGSGKTEVYLALIERVIAQGRSCIFLIPEISLTAQFVGIVQRRFPGVVGVWHSRVTDGEKYLTWQAAREGRIKVMLGARSALFAPFCDTGLIIIDEEHEPTYKQEQKPAYHTRDVAMELGRLCKAAVVLGSATPALESYYLAENKALTLLELDQRINERPLPEVKILDIKLMPKNYKVISQSLAGAMTRVLARREQAIVFLNRRGFSPSIICNACGNVWQCPNCSISLVYHKNPEGLQCHYCGHKRGNPDICPACKSRDISVFGVGTQKVEEELKRLFPQARIFRLDADTASKKGVYQQAYDDFRNEQFDILLGTQLVAKGFDFPRVTLVGVIDADTALALPDFRSAERTFQLITQVAGRSGRDVLSGEVIIQTRHPEHYALRAARKHDFLDFYRQELEFRRQLVYPPFCSLLNILVRGLNECRVMETAQAIHDHIAVQAKKLNERIDILGPTPASRSKLQGFFRWQLLLKGKRPSLIAVTKEIAESGQLPPGIQLLIDVDPQDTL
jgi:primosomal protein N' (replication factor Y)